MDNSKLLSFISFLGANTNDKDDELRHLYRRVLEGDEVYQQLKSLTQSTVFTVESTSSLTVAEKLLHEMQIHPARILETLNRGRNLAAELDSKRKKSLQALAKWNVKAADIQALPESEVTVFTEAYRQIALSAINMLLVLEGPKILESVFWNRAAGLKELAAFLEEKMLPEVVRSSRNAKPWMIYSLRCTSQGTARRHFMLCRSDRQLYESLKREVISSSVSPLCWHNPNWNKTTDTRTAYCWGIGNIVTDVKDDPEAVLSLSFNTVLDIPAERHFSQPLPDPYKVIRDLSNGLPSCISPEQLVERLNQWQSTYELQNRISHGRCLICAAPVPRGELVCQKHLEREWLEP